MLRSVTFIVLGVLGLVVSGQRVLAAPPPLPILVLLPPDSTDPLAPEGEYVPKWYSMFSNLPGDWARYSRETFRTENIPNGLADIHIWPERLTKGLLGCRA